MIENQLYKIVSSRIFFHPRSSFGKLLEGYLKSRQAGIATIGESFRLIKESVKCLRKLEEIRREREMLLNEEEAKNIYLAVISTENVPGDIAEVGVYQGGSAKLICEAKKGKRLHLFDTFEGLPEPSEKDGSYRKGQYECSLEKVQTYLAKYEEVYFYMGIAPLSAKPVEKTCFSFVHLDVDLYKSTSDCLRFFYPRLSKAGVLISHDYVKSVGVKRAFDEFFGDKPEPILRISSNQCLVVKVD